MIIPALSTILYYFLRWLYFLRRISLERSMTFLMTYFVINYFLEHYSDLPRILLL
jgi:hypothetical protein